MTRARDLADLGGNTSQLEQQGLVKIKPSSVAVGSGSGSANALGTVTFSGASSVSLNDVFSSTYDRYRVVVYTTPTANIGISFKFRVAGADNTTANYRYGSFFTNAIGGDATLYNQLGATEFNICQGYADPLTYSIDIHNPFNALKTIYNGTYYMHYTLTDYFQTGYTGGSFNDTTSFTGFTIGGGTQTGTVSIYGYTK